MSMKKYNLADRQTDRQLDNDCSVSIKFCTTYTKEVLPDSGNLIQAILPLCFFKGRIRQFLKIRKACTGCRGKPEYFCRM